MILSVITLAVCAVLTQVKLKSIYLKYRLHVLQLLPDIGNAVFKLQLTSNARYRAYSTVYNVMSTVFAAFFAR